MSTSPELTAEWTVTAKLRLIRPSDRRGKSMPPTSASANNKSSRHHEGSTQDDGGDSTSKVYVYKWTSNNPNQPIADNFDSSHQVSTRWRGISNDGDDDDDWHEANGRRCSVRTSRSDLAHLRGQCTEVMLISETMTSWLRGRSDSSNDFLNWYSRRDVEREESQMRKLRGSS